MRYAEVAVDAPIGYGRTLSYGIPPDRDIAPGQLVWVPLGARPIQGIVFSLSHAPQVEPTKDMIGPVGASPLISPVGLELARWISGHYMCSLFDAVSPMLPPGFQSRVRASLRLDPGGDHDSPPPGAADSTALEYLAVHGEVGEAELAKALGKDSQAAIRRLISRGLVQRRWTLPRPRTSHRYDCFVRLPMVDVDFDEEDLKGKGAARQRALYHALAQASGPIPVSIVKKEYGPPAVHGLHDKGLLAMEWVRVDREPQLQSQRGSESVDPVVPTPEQGRAIAEIESALDGKPGSPPRFLLHGVTGSGKTEVYLRALEHCVRKGKRGIVLVPEISLTPQAVYRLQARFPGKVALLHSRLTMGASFDQWWRMLDGDFQVVVGPRSAIFAPLPDLGLLVIDEEHEWTYKQDDATPRYHARDVALKLGELTGAVVLMASATPDVETSYRAREGRYRLLELPHRIVPAGPSGALAPRPSGPGLAAVQVCDMRQELKEGNRSIFSRALAGSLQGCVARGEQAILFLNRRGAATVVQCRDCGFVLRCRSCAVSLTYHAANARLLCHQCNRRYPPPRGCPHCRSPRIRYLGLGTQRVMEELGRTLPNLTALRWDGDTAQQSQAYENIMERFVRGDAQVLVGTQMVAKGLHVPNVSLVGVVLADTGLNLPDFRAGERAFQLLCQVSGRAGRGQPAGAVIIQTYNPTHYAVAAAARQDYWAMYDLEVQFRREHGNPPFGRLISMVYLNTNGDACQREAERMGRALRRRAYSRGLTGVEVVGPAPAFPQRVRGRYRWHVFLRGRLLHEFLEGIPIPKGWTVDVDPVTVL